MLQIQELVDASHSKPDLCVDSQPEDSSNSGSIQQLSSEQEPSQKTEATPSQKKEATPDKKEKTNTNTLFVDDPNNVQFTFTPGDPARERLLERLKV
jgi:hypothetical protein